MPPSRAGSTSILQAVEMRGETDQRTSYIGFVVIPVVLFLLANLIFVGIVVVYDFPVGGAATDVDAWFEQNQSNAGTIVGLAVLAGVTNLIAIVIGMIGIYKLIKRRNEHLGRDRLLRQGTIEMCREAGGEDDEVHEHVVAMERLHNEALLEENERSAGIHLLIGTLTFGLWFLYIFYFLLKDLPQHTRRQARFVRHANEALADADVSDREDLMPVEPIPERSYALFLGLALGVPILVGVLPTLLGFDNPLYSLPGNLVQQGTLLAFGYWVIQEPIDHFDRQWTYEDELIEIAQHSPDPKPSASQAQMPTPGSSSGLEGQTEDEEDTPAFTVWACGECGKKYKVPPKRPVRVTCKACGNQAILKE